MMSFFIKLALSLLTLPTLLFTLQDYPKFVAHRGHSSQSPENTLVSFEKAYEDGAKAIEFDCWLTKDNEVVIFHDPSLLRTARTNNHINNLTLEELKKLDAGSWFALDYKGAKIPTFKEVLQFAKGKDIQLCIELIDPNTELVDQVVACLEEENAQNPYLLFSAKLHLLQYAAKKYPHIPCAYVLRDFEERNIQEAKENHIQHLVLSQQVVHKELVEHLKREGFFLFVYTINDLDTSLEFLNYGIDSIISDYVHHTY